MGNYHFHTNCALRTHKFRNCILQIIKVDNEELKVHYYVEDECRRGYRKEKKAYWIDKDEIRKKLKWPHVEKMGLQREIFVFDGLN